MRKWFTRSVFPGVADVFANPLWLHNELMRDDFPTLDLPIKANSGCLAFGLSLSFWLLPAKSALVIFINVPVLEYKGTIFFCTLCEKSENGREDDTAGFAGEDKKGD